jgi:hypothetical protein
MLEQLHGFHGEYEFTAGRKGLGRERRMTRGSWILIPG